MSSLATADLQLWGLDLRGGTYINSALENVPVSQRLGDRFDGKRHSLGHRVQYGASPLFPSVIERPAGARSPRGDRRQSEGSSHHGDSRVNVDAQRFFFIHVMKTAGTTFRDIALSTFGGAGVYPDPTQDDMDVAYRSTEYLSSLPPERWGSVRCVTGHFPYFATEVLPVPFVSLTILRHPVERAISRLKHRQELDPPYRGWDLEEIYDDPFFFSMFIENYESKIFAMTPMDAPKTHWDYIEIDEGRLRTAKANLAKVDVIGFQDRFDEFLSGVVEGYGWRPGPVIDQRVSGTVEVSPSFRRRIEQDNAADMEFYEYALQLREQRRGPV